MGISWTEISPGEASAKINRANFAKNYGRFFSLEQATTKLPGRCIKVRFACMSRILCCFAEILLVELFVDRLAHSILAFACILPPWPIAESQDEKTAFAWTCATLFPIKWFAHHIDVYISVCTTFEHRVFCRISTHKHLGKLLRERERESVCSCNGTGDQAAGVWKERKWASVYGLWSSGCSATGKLGEIGDIYGSCWSGRSTHWKGYREAYSLLGKPEVIAVSRSGHGRSTPSPRGSRLIEFQLQRSVCSAKTDQRTASQQGNRGVDQQWRMGGTELRDSMEDGAVSSNEIPFHLYRWK